MPLTEVLQHSKIVWHGTMLYSHDWSCDSRSVAFTVLGHNNENLLHFMANAFWEPLTFQLPPADGKWVRTIDTSLPSPDDITLESEAPIIEIGHYEVQAHSIVVLRADGGARPIL